MTSRLAWALAAGLAALAPSCQRPDTTAVDPALVAMVDSLLPAVQRVSQLAALAPVRVDVRTPDQVRAFVEHKLDEELPPAELEGIRRAYAILGLIDADLDLRSLLLDLYSEQIAGYYDPDTKTLYALRGVPLPSLRPVMVHELVHALQDQHAPLDSLIARERGNDRQTAAQTALEGHATLAMFALLAEDAAGGPVDAATLPDLGSQLRPAFEDPSGRFPVFRRAPRVIRETLVFPYSAGASFVQQLWRVAGPGAGRQPPLGAWLPQSTEQVLYPLQKFLPVRDAPTELRFEVPGGWSTAYENTLGALESGILIEERLGPVADPAGGWDGDRFAVLERSDGAAGLVWASVWDDAAAADTFAARVSRAFGVDRPAVVERISLESRPAVLIRVPDRTVSAPDLPAPPLYCVDEAGRRIACSPP